DRSDRERAQAYLNGSKEHSRAGKAKPRPGDAERADFGDSEATAIELHQLGWGGALNTGATVDSKAILRVLRGKTPAEIGAIKAAYRQKYGIPLDIMLDVRMQGEWSAPWAFQEAKALLENRRLDAEAAAMRGSMGSQRREINLDVWVAKYTRDAG